MKMKDHPHKVVYSWLYGKHIAFPEIAQHLEAECHRIHHRQERLPGSFQARSTVIA